MVVRWLLKILRDVWIRIGFLLNLWFRINFCFNPEMESSKTEYRILDNFASPDLDSIRCMLVRSTLAESSFGDVSNNWVLLYIFQFCYGILPYYFNANHTFVVLILILNFPLLFLIFFRESLRPSMQFFFTEVCQDE